MKRAALALLLLAAGCESRDQERPRLAKSGEPAPELRLSKLLNSPLPELKGWHDLQGKAAVLLFWAGWCDSCPEPMASLSALAGRFSGEPVVFLAISDEKETDVREYLRTKPTRAWVAAEAGPELFRAYRVYGRPYAALVSRDGRVAALKPGGEVDEEEVRRLISQAAPAPKAGPGTAAGAVQSPGQGEPLAEFYISEAREYGGSGTFGADSLKARGMRLQYALDYALGRADKVEVKPSASLAMAAYYDIRMQFPKGRGEKHKRDFFLKGINTALGLKVGESVRDSEVWVLRKAPGGPLNLKKREASGSVRFEGSRCVVEGGSLSVLCEALSSRLGEQVRDETGLQGSYSYVFDFREGDSRVFAKLLQSQLGLTLQRKLRKVRVLEISRPEP